MIIVRGTARFAPGEIDRLRPQLNAYIHYDDAARAFMLAAQTDRPGHTPLNICAADSCIPWSKEVIERTFGAVPPFRRPVSPDQSLICGRRAAELIGFHPMTRQVKVAA